MSTPAISIVITTRGEAPYLGRVLTALDCQHDLGRAEREIIVVADGAGCPGAAAARQVELSTPLRLIEIVRAGPGAARDAGWRQACAPLVVFLDDDVVAGPELVAQHVRSHGDSDQRVVIGHVSPPAGPRQPWTTYDDQALAKKYRRLGGVEVPAGIHYGGNVSIPRSLLESVGGHDHALVQDADVDLGARLLAAGAEFVYAPGAAAERFGECGYEEWRQRHFLHGRIDVALHLYHGFSGGVPSLVGCFHDRHLLNRLVVRTALSRPGLEQRLPDLLARAGATAYRAGAGIVSYSAFSFAANILYWSGVRDGLRGNQQFWKAVKEARHVKGRPYQLVPKTARR